MQDTWYAVVNPVANSERGYKRWMEIEKRLFEMDVDFVCRFTDDKGDGITYTREAIEKGYRKILAVGGDGTINEVVNGILTQSAIAPQEVTVGMISIGTGNDWIKTMGLPKDGEAATELIARGIRTRTIDAGKAVYQLGGEQHTRYFINVAGMAYDAFVTKDATENKVFKGAVQYQLSVLKGLTRYQKTNVKLQADDYTYEGKLFCLNVGICNYAGGGMKVVPEAVPDDGLFHVTVMKDLTKLDVVLNTPKLFNGTFISHPKVDSVPAKHVTVESDTPIFLEVEGEVLGHSPFEFELIPACIQVLVG